MSGWGAASTVGGAAGVTVGGLLTAALGWQSVLFVTGAVAAVIGVAGWVLLPAGKEARDAPVRRHRRHAPHGAAVAVVFGVLSAPHSGLVSVEVIAAAAVAIACLIGFGLVERRAPTRSCLRACSATPA